MANGLSLKYFVVALTIFASSQALLITWSEIAGKTDYDETTVNLIVDGLKCILSLLVLFKIRKSDGITQDNKLSMPLNEAFFYAIPAGLWFMRYLLLDSYIIYLDGRTNPPSNILNIISTVVLCCLILKIKLTRLQLIAIILLFFGCTLAHSDPIRHTSLQGWVMAIVLAILSGLSEVCKETIFKKYPSKNINVQNFWFFTFGFIVNLVVLCNHDFKNVISKGFFHGYSLITVCMIFNHALREIIVSMVLKYADNIVKVYSTSVAMFLTAIISKFLFGFQLSIISFGGFMLVLASAMFHGVCSTWK